MFNSRLNPHLLRLATAQALAGANSTVVYATGAIIGNVLAPNPALATRLPAHGPWHRSGALISGSRAAS
ncbi:exported protein of unknown function [Ralstonia solanacearum CMR15]|nr:exported protein of unknown function [Ralstonia solanacearum CMR15]